MTTTDTKPKRKNPLLTAVLVLLLLCFGVFIALIFVFPIIQSAPPNYKIYNDLAAYDEIVQLIESGAFPSGSVNGYNITLPLEYQDLSPIDGKVLVYDRAGYIQILFYFPSSSGLLGTGRWVYTYTSNDQPLDLHGECSRQERHRPNWFWFHCP